MFHSGDEIGTVVADFGSSSHRIGLAGDDMPKYIGSNAVGIIPPKEANTSKQLQFPPLRYQAGQDLSCPIQDGLVQDWDSMEQIWNHALRDHLRISLEGRPVLMAEKPYVSAKDRQRWTEIMFEKFRVGGLFLSKDVVLACYACGKTTGLVLDCGASGTITAPVVDGWIETKGLARNRVGGHVMDQFFLGALTQKQSRPVPAYRLQRRPPSSAADLLEATSARFDAFMTLALARDVKESTAKVSQYALRDSEATYANMPLTPYELPDGTIVQTGLERFQGPELFFDVSTLSSIDNSDLQLLYGAGSSSLGSKNTPTANETVLRQVIDTVFKCDGEYQVPMLSNIIVSGGASVFEGFVDRLRNEVEAVIHINSPAVKVRTLANPFPERGVTPWLGGSIVGSLGSFHEMWVNRAEYAEYGAGIVDKKCP